MFCESAVEEGPVGGDEVCDGAIVRKHGLDEAACLLGHGPCELLVVFGIEVVGFHVQEPSKLEPLICEVVEETVGFWVLEKSVCFSTEACGGIDGVGICCFAEGIVGKTAPEESREAVCESV